VLATIAVCIFMGLTLMAAGRLLAVWWGSRRLPELLIAVLILGVGTVAVGLGFLLRNAPPGTVAHFLPALGADVGMTAMVLFTWRVYRPGSAAAGCVALMLAGVLFGLLAWSVHLGHLVTMQTNAAGLTNSATYVGVMAWSAVEALLYWRPMVRRQRLGLADAVVTNRVLLWGIATGVCAAGILIGALAQHVAGLDPRQSVFISMAYALFGSVAAIAFWLAFAPPAAYVGWVRARTEDSAVETATDGSRA
jgi:hypothetical protein